MRYHALATDYDGTLAHDGHVDRPTVAALEKLLATGRKLVLVTGRELDELLGIFPEIRLFEQVVVENGALLYNPASREETALATPPPPEFVDRLRRKGVERVSAGRVIVATWTPYEAIVLDTIREMGLELQVIFNKGAVMVLPAGVNKAFGLKAALRKLSMSPHEVVGVGDAENDHAFLSICECGVAVANALPALKDRADLVTRGDHGAGVAELIDEMVADDLDRLDGKIARHQLLFGTRDDGSEITLPPYGPGILIAGPSGSGKSTAATSLLERLRDHRYQFCIIDPEGDYESLEGAITLGNSQRAPNVEEVLELLAAPDRNAVVNLIGMSVGDRPLFFLGLLPRLLELRARTGRPHWLLVDEAHHLLPASWEPATQALGGDLSRIVFITVHPGQVSPAALAAVETVIVVGADVGKTIGEFSAASGQRPPPVSETELSSGEVMLWSPHRDEPPYRAHVAPSSIEHRRHTRKYAQGELPPEQSFYFRGPEGKLNLRAQNLMLFLQLAEGVDEGTWVYHLRQGDYSRWFREYIKDDELAGEAETAEKLPNLSPADSRKLIKAAVEKRYTLPASSSLPMPGTDAAPGR